MATIFVFIFCFLGFMFAMFSIMQERALESFTSFIVSIFFFGMMFVMIYGPEESYQSGYTDALKYKPLGEKVHTSTYTDGYNDGKKDIEEAGKRK